MQLELKKNEITLFGKKKMALITRRRYRNILQTVLVVPSFKPFRSFLSQETYAQTLLKCI